MELVAKTLIRRRGLSFACPAIFCLTLCAGTMMRAQSTATGEIRGTVTDPSGAVLVGAQVSVTNTATGEEKTFITNKDGLYDTVSTPNGSYTVTISAGST